MSNKFNWTTYLVPHRWTSEADKNETEEDEVSPPAEETFTIRHLKQGATGAVKTWPAAEVLLEYLVRRGGLRDVCDKIVPDDGGSGDVGILDLISPPSTPLSFENLQSELKPYNIVELGGGTGYLSVALALALNSIDSSTPVRRRARLICTDNDRATIKNMRHNIARQPLNMNMNKTVRIEPLDWGSDVGGEKFSKVVTSQFQEKTKKTQLPKEERPAEPEDPIRLLSHLIASDVHYGKTTLEPLSTVISAIKLRNPNVAVILLLKERSPNAVADLKEQIEAKVQCGLELEEQSRKTELRGFLVSVRDVLHRELPDMKMVEC
jgi:hypothetical protein